MSRLLTKPRVSAVGLLLVFAALFFGLRHLVAPPAKRIRPNIVLIQIDTLRPDHVGSYGYHRPTTPNLDRFARTGVQFRNAYSVTSWTLPATTSLLTGLLPSRHGVKAIGDLLSESIPTLARHLHDGGYVTAAISANFAFVNPGDSFPAPPLHLGQGFDDFEVLFKPAAKDDREGETVAGRFVRTERARRIATRMSAFVRTAREPFFLFGVFIDPHFGYEPPSEYRLLFEPVASQSPVTGFMQDASQLGEPLSPEDVSHLTNLYDGEIRTVDDQIARFLGNLEQSGIADHTIVVILSDHGEAFLEHGKMLHGQTLYENELRIPLVLRGPGVPKGAAVEELASITDVMPTILDLVGLPIPPHLDGRSLTPTWQASPPKDHRDLVFELDNEPELLNGPRLHVRGLRADEWKFIASLDGKQELYDISKDPGEQHDVAQVNPAVVARLAAALGHHPTGTPAPVSRPTLSDAEKERLRALGYGTGAN